MARKVFFSFHFANDFWRTQQVRQINALEGNPIATPNAWEEVKRRGNASIEKWIDDEMQGKTCLIALVGAETANRPWVIYEISKAWNENRGVLGIRIDGLKDVNGQISSAGPNPFDKVTFNSNGRSLSSVVPLKTPRGWESKAVYGDIASNIESWIEEAIATRKSFAP